ncbi:PP2C family serine/threonine-protein phosphatase [uncultured Mobiluncus sp.]|uniref:PP2C family protein-serine/threonine phosphatase n=1 Tax=uncultured Mobiluncus sp. TaxID=293425 RepID=UPI002615F08A|nr:protein phosphatase 2C domain-containing protein [uncultured Mobiluncus sp.]
MEIETGTWTFAHGETLHWAAATDIGLKRAENQDSFLATPPFFLVADGMGGHAGGKQASATLLGHIQPLTGTDVSLPVVRKVLEAACEEVMGLVEANIDYTISPPGTTLTGLVVLDSPGQGAADGSASATATDGSETAQFLVLNVGDSRTYVLREGLLTRLTRDHSQVAEMVEAGMLTVEEARVWPTRSVITRAIGAGQAGLPQIDTWTYPVATPRRFLVCSDGLHSMIDDGAIGRALGEHPTPEAAVNSLVNLALQAGGHDNVTAIVVDVTAPESASAPTESAQSEPPEPPGSLLPPPPPPESEG